MRNTKFSRVREHEPHMLYVIIPYYILHMYSYTLRIHGMLYTTHLYRIIYYICIACGMFHMHLVLFQSICIWYYFKVRVRFMFHIPYTVHITCYRYRWYQILHIHSMLDIADTISLYSIFHIYDHYIPYFIYIPYSIFHIPYTVHILYTFGITYHTYIPQCVSSTAPPRQGHMFNDMM